jgi:hypothetical protein
MPRVARHRRRFGLPENPGSALLLHKAVDERCLMKKNTIILQSRETVTSLQPIDLWKMIVP